MLFIAEMCETNSDEQVVGEQAHRNQESVFSSQLYPPSSLASVRHTFLRTQIWTLPESPNLFPVHPLCGPRRMEPDSCCVVRVCAADG